MKVKVIKAHQGEGQFPTFEEGTEVIMKEECTHFIHWNACEINGHQTYVPNIFVANGKLTRDYNPTELIQEAGDIVDVHEIIYAWLLAKNEKDITGWIPAEVVVSININRYPGQ